MKGYTVEETCKKLDRPNEFILHMYSKGVLDGYRKYWLFGEILFDKEEIDIIAPYVTTNSVPSREEVEHAVAEYRADGEPGIVFSRRVVFFFNDIKSWFSTKR